MNLSAPFVRRPVATALLSLGVLLAGALSYLELPVAALPRIEVPSVLVQAQLPGAGPETMAASMAAPGRSGVPSS